MQKGRIQQLWSEQENLSSAEVSYEKFVGQGTFDNPEAVNKGKLELTPKDALLWKEYGEKNQLFAYPPVCALMYDYELAPGETKGFNQCFKFLQIVG